MHNDIDTIPFSFLCKNARINYEIVVAQMLAECAEVQWDVICFSETRAKDEDVILEAGHRLYCSRGSIYKERSFFVQDYFGASERYGQDTGIAQGCPLSPFLFIIVQSVMFHDIYARLHFDPEPAFVVTRELLYADDTLLALSSPKNLQMLLDAICAEGLKYGLELNWDKTYQMSVCHPGYIVRPDGTNITRKRDVVYLGGLITCDGKVSREVSRKLGEGRAIFSTLSKLWSHANLSVRRRVAIFNACITSKVLWSLESLWLLKSDLIRLNAFQAYCLRRICRIAPSFISRVTNLSVLERASQVEFVCTLRDRQRRLFTKIQNCPPCCFINQLVCDSDGQPKIWHSRRSRGRPCQRWTTEVYRANFLN